ncbi:adapter molecule Crk [Phymastichus coffea]|uniref:adapter molecule Crk n=1 Tax=Phymastichus coffea TaxID=108790 RepID=UPI00273C606C|nr:adapter molecule Crk [Phymastichus coffea]
MAGTFDQYDKDSWYFGPMSRQDASDLLMSEKEGGVFLVRDSISIHGDFVLCVREDSKVSHYIINKIQQGDKICYRIGDQIFPDIPSLLAFYKLHYLDTTPLIRPAPRKIQRVIARYDFEGNDPDDLPFRKGEILTIISKDEEQWWTARNSLGQAGSVPVPYVQKYEEDNNTLETTPARPESGGSSGSGIQSLQTESIQTATRRSNIQRTLPAFAKVKQARVPNAYDKTALKLEVGDVIKVTKTNINGQWEGELHGKVGHFPFTHVEFIDDTTNEESQEI